MNRIDLNEIYKKLYYKYILSFKVLDILGVKHSSNFKSWAKNQGLRIILKTVKTKIFLHLRNLRNFGPNFTLYSLLFSLQVNGSYTKWIVSKK